MDTYTPTIIEAEPNSPLLLRLLYALLEHGLANDESWNNHELTKQRFRFLKVYADGVMTLFSNTNPTNGTEERWDLTAENVETVKSAVLASRLEL